MRIAIPLAEGKLSPHFGHCEQFALIDVDVDTKEITHSELLAAPDHQPGLLPEWLAQHGANLIIAGGMGQRAQSLFAQKGIKVVIGATTEKMESIVTSYLEGTLQTGANFCDH